MWQTLVWGLHGSCVTKRVICVFGIWDFVGFKKVIEKIIDVVLSCVYFVACVNCKVFCASSGNYKICWSKI